MNGLIDRAALVSERGLSFEGSILNDLTGRAGGFKGFRIFVDFGGPDEMGNRGGTNRVRALAEKLPTELLVGCTKGRWFSDIGSLALEGPALDRDAIDGIGGGLSTRSGGLLA